MRAADPARQRSARSRSARSRRCPWQVVGYVERCEVAGERRATSRPSGASTCSTTAPRASPSSSTPKDGWSWTAPITGAPRDRSATSVTHEGVLYRKLYDYTGKVTYVLGEFYWRLTRDAAHRATPTTRAPARRRTKRLNREQHRRRAAAQEIVWSAGETLARRRGDERLPARAASRRAALQRDAPPTTFSGASLLAQDLLLGLHRRRRPAVCSAAAAAAAWPTAARLRNTFGDASQEYQSCLNNQTSGGGYRSGGGSFGGFSSGGGHK